MMNPIGHSRYDSPCCLISHPLHFLIKQRNSTYVNSNANSSRNWIFISKKALTTVKLQIALPFLLVAAILETAIHRFFSLLFYMIDPELSTFVTKFAQSSEFTVMRITTIFFKNITGGTIFDKEVFARKHMARFLPDWLSKYIYRPQDRQFVEYHMLQNNNSQSVQQISQNPRMDLLILSLFDMIETHSNRPRMNPNTANNGMVDVCSLIQQTLQPYPAKAQKETIEYIKGYSADVIMWISFLIIYHWVHGIYKNHSKPLYIQQKFWKSIQALRSDPSLNKAFNTIQNNPKKQALLHQMTHLTPQQFDTMIILRESKEKLNENKETMIDSDIYNISQAIKKCSNKFVQGNLFFEKGGPTLIKLLENS